MINIELSAGQSLYPLFLLHSEIVKKDDREFGIVECDISIKKRDGGIYRKTTKFFVEPDLAKRVNDKEYVKCNGVFEMVDPLNPCRLINLLID